MLEKLCKDCDNKECSRRTPVGGCHEMTLEEAQKLLLLEADWDWEKFRREAAKDILCALMQCGIQDTWRIMCENAINGADELIAKLKEK